MLELRQLEYKPLYLIRLLGKIFLWIMFSNWNNVYNIYYY